MPEAPEKKQGLSLGARKVMLWALMIVIGTGLIFWWFKAFQGKIKNIGGEELKKELNVDLLKDQFKNLPQLNGQE